LLLMSNCRAAFTCRASKISRFYPPAEINASDG
jgi:hypothetical protein